MSGFQSILRQGLVYGLGSVAAKAMNIILFPIVSKYISVAEYGVLVRVEVLWQFLFVIVNCGTTVAVFNELHKAGTPEARASVLSTMMSWYVIVGLAVCTVLFGFKNTLAGYLLGSERHAMLIVLAGSVALLEMLLFVPLLELRERERPWSYLGLTLTSLALGAIAQVTAILAFENRLEMMYLLRLLGPIVAISAGAWVVSGLFRLRFDRSMLRRILLYSGPVLVSGLMALGLSGVDRYLLGLLRSDHEVGLYGLGYNVSGLLNLFVVSPLLLVVHAVMWKMAAGPEGPQFFSRLMTHSVVLFGCAAVGVSLFGYSIIRVFALNADYWGAAGYVPVLSYAYILFGLASVGMLSFYIGHKTRYMIYVYGAAIVTNVALNVWLIPEYGADGSSLAAAVGNGVLFAMTILLSFKAYVVPYAWKTILGVLILAGAWIAVGQLIEFERPLIEASARLVWCLLFPLILALTGIYGRTEWALAFRLLLPRPVVTETPTHGRSTQ